MLTADVPDEDIDFTTDDGGEHASAGPAGVSCTRPFPLRRRVITGSQPLPPDWAVSAEYSMETDRDCGWEPLELGHEYKLKDVAPLGPGSETCVKRVWVRGHTTSPGCVQRSFGPVELHAPKKHGRETTRSAPFELPMRKVDAEVCDCSLSIAASTASGVMLFGDSRCNEGPGDSVESPFGLFETRVLLAVDSETRHAWGFTWHTSD